MAGFADILVDVFFFAYVGAGVAETQGVDPELEEFGFVQASYGDLLDSKDVEGAGG